jgi:cysteinyl-tRNA synthetase
MLSSGADEAPALAGIFDAARRANRAIDEGDVERASSIVNAVDELLGVLGLDRADTDGDDDAIDALVRERDDARANRDFARADAIRDDLTARGIKLEDTPTGTIWHR